MHRRIPILAFAALALGGCATPQKIPGCRQFDCVALGEQQIVAPGIAARPLTVREDSRCPIEAECIQAGRVLVETELEIGDEITTVALDSSEPMHINAGLLSLAEIAPAASTQWMPIAPEHYRFAFRFVPDVMVQGDTDPGQH